MFNALVKAGAVFALGGFAFAGPALAASPLPLNDSSRLVMPVGDMENEEVGHDLEPSQYPAPSALEGQTPKDSAVERPKEEGGAGGNVENEEVWHDLEPSQTPPPAAVGQ